MKTNIKPAAKSTKAPAKPAAPAKARRLEDLSRGRAGAFALTPTLIRPEPGFNGREDLGDLRALAADIEANGLLQPLKIRKDRGTEDIWLIDGHRRHAAITTILIPEGRWPKDKEDPKLPGPVHCTAEPVGTRPIDRLFMQLSMNSGKSLTFLEEARLYQRILAEDSTLKAADIARRTGKTKQAISDSLRLVNDGSALLLEHVRKGTLAASTAVAIIKASQDPEAQEAALTEALATAKAAGRSHVMPKDLTKADSPTPPDQSGSSEEPEPPAQSTTPTPPAKSSTPPTPSKDPEKTATATFTLYVIDGTPEDPVEADSPLYHETDRFALEHPQQFGLDRLHLLCASTTYGPAYGYRVNDHEHLPDVSGLTLQADPQEGFNAVLETACRKAGLATKQQDELSSLLFDALCDYFPEEGTPKEPQRLAFVGAPQSGTPAGSTPDSEGRTGFDAIRNAPSGGGNGGGGGGGGSTYLDPQTFKAVQKIEKVLEELADKDKGIPERVTTADIIIGILRNERPASDLKNYLTGK